MDVISLEEMAKLKEDGFRLRVLIPLLRKIGYSHVKDWHGGSAEQGKDIVCWRLDELRHRRNLAIVAKAVNFRNNASKKDACAQVEQALNLRFSDKETGEEQIVHDCWIVTNKNLAVGSRGLIRGILGPSINPRVKILDGRDVWDLVVQYFPIELSQAIQEVTERINTSRFATQLVLGEVERPIARISFGDKTVVIGEKHPGQLEAEPFNIQAAFAFPDNEEGQAKAEELRNAIQGRGSASIPGEYIRRFQMPEDAVEHASTILGPIPEELAQIEITPHEPRLRILASLEIAPDEGEPAAIPYLDLVEQSRTEDSITLTNEHQPIPTQVTLKLDPETKRVTWSVSLRPVPVAAPLYLGYLKFIAATDQAGEASITLLDPGLPWGRTRNPGRDTPLAPPEEVDWVADLALIQSRTGVPIYVPFEDLKDAEVETIRFLQFILNNPVVPQTWDKVRLVFEWTAEQAREMFQAFGSPEGVRVRVVETKAVDLFGANIPLGRVEQVFMHARLENMDDLWREVERLTDGSAEFTIDLTPGTSNIAEARYLDWGALTKEEEDANNSTESGEARGEPDDTAI